MDLRAMIYSGLAILFSLLTGFSMKVLLELSWKEPKQQALGLILLSSCTIPAAVLFAVCAHKFFSLVMLYE